MPISFSSSPPPSSPPSPSSSSSFSSSSSSRDPEAANANANGSGAIKVRAVESAPSSERASEGLGLRLKIDDKWYDLTAWAPVHPGGAAILHHLDGQDATDAFYALHSEEAVARMLQMKSTPCLSGEKNHVPAVLRSFRSFQQKLHQRGFWVRSVFWELVYALHVCALTALGAHLAVQGWALVSCSILSLAFVQAFWNGHDYGHARGSYFLVLYRLTFGVLLGFSPTWWQQNHNAHHLFTNHEGIDLDIDSEPIFYFRVPPAEADTHWRRCQHWYFFPIVALTHLSWRMKSITHAWTTHNHEELFLLLLNYLWLAQLPLVVSLGSVLVSGFIVAVIVTTNHQSEEMYAAGKLKGESYNFVLTQFLATRDADTNSNFFLAWMFGGMQHQLEHHLFPTMPRYYYSQIAPQLRHWAAEQKLVYKVDGVFEIILRNWKTIQFFSGSGEDRVLDRR